MNHNEYIRFVSEVLNPHLAEITKRRTLDCPEYLSGCLIRNLSAGSTALVWTRRLALRLEPTGEDTFRLSWFTISESEAQYAELETPYPASLYLQVLNRVSSLWVAEKGKRHV